MKITPARLTGFLRQPGPEFIAVLFFGPDQGLVHERAQMLARTVVDDLNDPFRVVEISAKDLKADPAALIDGAAQMSMTGGRKVFWVQEAGDAVSSCFTDFFVVGNGLNLVIVEAGNLASKSSLRKLFEKVKNGASIGCYADDGRGLESVIRESLDKHGLRADRDAIAFLAANLGGDRLMTRSELNKLALYCTDKKSSNNKGSVTLDDAMASIGDSAAMSMDAVVYAAAGGDPVGLDSALERAFVEGISPVVILRATQSHLRRLHSALGMVENGSSPNKAVSALRPPVIYKFKDQFLRQVRQWRLERLGQAMALATEAEADCKTTGFPANAGCHRALIRIAQAAKARMRAR
ncbi:MAG: DNA polymerase III subunit delta [Rhodospirillales bacterium]